MIWPHLIPALIKKKKKKIMVLNGLCGGAMCGFGFLNIAFKYYFELTISETSASVVSHLALASLKGFLETRVARTAGCAMELKLT